MRSVCAWLLATFAFLLPTATTATERVVVVGSGPAGLTAAIYAARAGLEPLLIEGYEAGGQLMLTSEVENYPGFPQGTDGPGLIELIREQALRFGTRIVTKDVTGLELDQQPFVVWIGNEPIEADTVILSTGASAKWLDIPGEERLRGRGVSSCATCDGFFFRNKQVVVVGGGDTAMEEALVLANLASKVTIIHRRDQFRASHVLAERALAHPKIEVIWDSVVEEVLGEGDVTGLTVRHLPTDKQSVFSTDALFVAIGHHPNSDLVRDQLELDEHGYVVVHGRTETSIPGVFAAGDLADPVYRQAITAAASGCQAALDARSYLE